MKLLNTDRLAVALAHLLAKGPDDVAVDLEVRNFTTERGRAISGYGGSFTLANQTFTFTVEPDRLRLVNSHDRVWLIKSVDRGYLLSECHRLDVQERGVVSYIEGRLETYFGQCIVFVDYRQVDIHQLVGIRVPWQCPDHGNFMMSSVGFVMNREYGLRTGTVDADYLLHPTVQFAMALLVKKQGFANNHISDIAAVTAQGKGVVTGLVNGFTPLTFYLRRKLNDDTINIQMRIRDHQRVDHAAVVTRDQDLLTIAGEVNGETFAVTYLWDGYRAVNVDRLDLSTNANWITLDVSNPTVLRLL